MMTSGEIRKQFLDFFKSKQHAIVPSAPIVVKDDPTLMFTNAGMNQFKDYFLGNKHAQHARVADTQKCLRVSGKHNDLEEVGVDTYHHTMFEMLGNWSFGDPARPEGGYFKNEAIAWSWELLTGVYKIDKDRLYVTVFEGDDKERLPKDDEAISFWKHWIAEDRIIMGNKKDNFWEMGDTGPCGPCTEIHVDTRTDEERKKVDGKSLVNHDHPQVIEIWNNVFIQYNRNKDGSLEPLPAKHVDTGMGFERLVRVLQNKQSNYDTDIFMPTIEAIEKITGINYNRASKHSSTGGGLEGAKQDIAFRVIADHIRAIAFPVADGQLPSNTGAGYVIRRILRRAVRYYFSYMDVKQPLLHKLIPVIAKQFENVFPELDKQKDFIGKVIKEEEEAFLRTVANGLAMLDKATHDISGEEAFKLYDTFGFPLDLTKLVAGEKGRKVDEQGFNKAMQLQKNRSRAAAVIDTEDWIVISENGSSKFVGYDSFESESKVVKYRKTKSQGTEAYQVVLDKTPFYAESGGQAGDKGSFIFDGEEIEVYDTKKDNDLIVHFAQKLPATISENVIAKVDRTKRIPTQVHHSATHLMHAALRTVLGKHVAQKGSLVNDEYLRFDFSHFAKVTDEELGKVEELVNEKIRQNIPVVIKEMKKDDAIATGAMALFGEKYGDVVRVVIMDPGYSIELCGGTHAGSTGELGFFKIKHETAIGAGIRRIEAVSGIAAECYLNQQCETIRSIRDTLKNPKDLTKAIENLSEENKSLRKRVELLENKQVDGIKKELLSKVTNKGFTLFIGEIVDIESPDSLKKLCIELLSNISKPEAEGSLVIICSKPNDKAFVALGVDNALIKSKNLDASQIIKEHIAPLIKGGGGGQKTLATASGQDASRLQEVIDKVKSLL